MGEIGFRDGERDVYIACNDGARKCGNDRSFIYTYIYIFSSLPQSLLLNCI